MPGVMVNVSSRVTRETGLWTFLFWISLSVLINVRRWAGASHAWDLNCVNVERVFVFPCFLMTLILALTSVIGFLFVCVVGWLVLFVCLRQNFSVALEPLLKLLCRPGSNSQRSACLCLPSAGIKGVRHDFCDLVDLTLNCEPE